MENKYYRCRIAKHLIDKAQTSNVCVRAYQSRKHEVRQQFGNPQKQRQLFKQLVTFIGTLKFA